MTETVLQQACLVQQHAATLGFDWRNPEDIITKIREELEEVLEALTSNDQAHIAEEIGDTLFAVVNLARNAGFNPEILLHAATEKFSRRFAYMQLAAEQENSRLEQETLEQLEQRWQKAKAGC